MLQDADLDVAVAQGIITQAQLDAMRALAVRRSGITAADRADDERFRFLRGFNDIFFTVGVALLTAGVAYFAGRFPFGNVLALAVTWVLAEILVGRQRLVLPGILVACLFVKFAVGFAQADMISRVITDQWMSRWPLGNLLTLTNLGHPAVAWNAVAAALAAALFYARFRLPFTLLLIAGAIIVAMLATVDHLMGDGGTMVRASLLLACGVGVFVIAM